MELTLPHFYQNSQLYIILRWTKQTKQKNMQTLILPRHYTFSSKNVVSNCRLYLHVGQLTLGLNWHVDQNSRAEKTRGRKLLEKTGARTKNR